MKDETRLKLYDLVAILQDKGESIKSQVEFLTASLCVRRLSHSLNVSDLESLYKLLEGVCADVRKYENRIDDGIYSINSISNDMYQLLHSEIFQAKK